MPRTSRGMTRVIRAPYSVIPRFMRGIQGTSTPTPDPPPSRGRGSQKREVIRSASTHSLPPSRGRVREGGWIPRTSWGWRTPAIALSSFFSNFLLRVFGTSLRLFQISGAESRGR